MRQRLVLHAHTQICHTSCFFLCFTECALLLEIRKYTVSKVRTTGTTSYTPEIRMASSTGPKNEEWQLVDYPDGMVTKEHFKKAEISMPDPQDGELLVRALDISVDPYMRGRMTPPSPGAYFSSFEPGKAIDGTVVGIVEQSKADDFKKGDIVQGFFPWRKYFTAQASGAQKCDTSSVSPSAYLGILGLTGLSAYFPSLEIGAPKEGEVAFVSGAAGAVGSTAGQIFKIKGCKVIGSAGSDEKVQYLINEMGFDSAFNYRKKTVDEALKEFAPKGIDIYWDNVGGETLDQVFPNMRSHGRIVACGAISQYNLRYEERYGLKNYMTVVFRQLKYQGFLLFQYVDRFAEGVKQLSQWLQEGKLKHRETTYEGFDRIPEAFLALFEGKNIGKTVVHISDP
eukprot:gb/GECG01015979.1/.p1 GENE.gb/GECG01015979.1/~~gb/GECG01015979.1/.p1  ORF type:complete len:397 (+),score=49.37 gb/GECG01015979.1/:1-1191(+)